MQLWEYGSGIANQIKTLAVNLKEEGRDIMDYDIKAEAKGSGKQKKYTLTLRTTALPVPEGVRKHDIEEDVPF